MGRLNAPLDHSAGPRNRLDPSCFRIIESVFIHSFLPALKNLFFGLDPVIEFRSGLIPSPDVQLIGPAPDLFFEWKLLNLASLGGSGHGGHLRRSRYHRPCP